MNLFARWRMARMLRRRRIRYSDWRAGVAGLPIVRGLSAVERARLRGLTTLFLARKVFTGAQGMAVTGAMRLSIAAQACLPILNLNLNAYTGWVEIIVYPGVFRVAREGSDAAGVVHRESRVLSGESWSRGPLLLAWDEVRWDLDDPRPGSNVVIHEFAHKLDMQNGAANGMPPLHADMSIGEWTAAMREAWDELRGVLDHGDAPAPINPYAASDPAEFFAVVSEYFFTAPGVLLAAYPRVYAQLSRYYRQQPLQRFGIG